MSLATPKLLRPNRSQEQKIQHLRSLVADRGPVTAMAIDVGLGTHPGAPCHRESVGKVFQEDVPHHENRLILSCSEVSKHLSKAIYDLWCMMIMIVTFYIDYIDFARFAMICNKYSRYYIQIAYGAPWYPTRNVARHQLKITYIFFKVWESLFFLQNTFVCHLCAVVFFGGACKKPFRKDLEPAKLTRNPSSKAWWFLKSHYQW